MLSRTGSHVSDVGSSEHGHSNHHQATHLQAQRGETKEEGDDVIFISSREKVQTGPKPKGSIAKHEQSGVHSDFRTFGNEKAGSKEEARQKLGKKTQVMKASREEDSDDDVVEIEGMPESKGKARLHGAPKNRNDNSAGGKGTRDKSKDEGLVQGFLCGTERFALT